ncbi:MAG: hypothetical protein K6F50_04550 [Kiritimatiellae bacterium]|nr:hypothetical protein [Kiritimatiellia bacterium]
MKSKEELDAYLAKIRKTIADSRALVEQTELRFAETDRLLASQGLTREKVKEFRFTERQREAVNREMVRMGLEPLSEDETRPIPAGGQPEEIAPEKEYYADCAQNGEFSAEDDELSNRRMKFAMMMKPFRI